MCAVEWSSTRHKVIFNIEEKTLILDRKKYLLRTVTNKKLIEMLRRKKVFIPENHYKDERVLYYCVRGIAEGINKYGIKLFIDILLYNDALETIGKDIYNRSLGHRNDVKEMEIHQVLTGKVLELVEYQGNRYLGMFGEGEYFEIPAGSFHCTYVLENKTIVANIFGNVFWDNNFKSKPYSTYKNIVSLEKKGNEFLYKTEDGSEFLLNDSLDNLDKIGCRDFADLDENELIITSMHMEHVQDIFDLFECMTKRSEED